MNKFLVFLAGVVTSVVVVGGLAFWFLVLQPGGEKPKDPVAPIVAPVTGQQTAPGAGGVGKPAGGGAPVGGTPAGGAVQPQPPVAGGASPPVPSGASSLVNFPLQEGNFTASADTITQGGAKDRLYLEGKISVPPALKKIVEKSPNAVLALRVLANSAGPTEGGNLVEATGFTKVTYPMQYKLEISRAWVEALRKFESFPIFVRALICLEKTENERCSPSVAHNIQGTIRFRAVIPRELKTSAIIPAPTIIMNRYHKKVDPAACSAGGGVISGVLQATPAFKKTGIKKVMVLAMPYRDKRPPLPFAGPYGGGLKATEADLAKAASAGVIYQAVNVAADAKFSLKVPSGFESELFRTYYVACADNESDTACLLKAFPVSMLQVPGDRARAAVAMVAKGFESAYCGMKAHPFFLHVWDPNAMRANEQSLHLADPPEVIEGAVY